MRDGEFARRDGFLNLLFEPNAVTAAQINDFVDVSDKRFAAGANRTCAECGNIFFEHFAACVGFAYDFDEHRIFADNISLGQHRAGRCGADIARQIVVHADALEIIRAVCNIFDRVGFDALKIGNDDQIGRQINVLIRRSILSIVGSRIIAGRREIGNFCFRRFAQNAGIHRLGNEIGQRSRRRPSQNIRRDLGRFRRNAAIFEQLARNFARNFIERLDDFFGSLQNFADHVPVAHFSGEHVAGLFAFQSGLKLGRHCLDGDQTAHAPQRFIGRLVVIGISLRKIGIRFESFFFGDLKTFARLKRFYGFCAGIFDGSVALGNDDLLHFDFFGRRVLQNIRIVISLNVGFSRRGKRADFFVGKGLERFKHVFGRKPDDFERNRRIGLLISIPKGSIGNRHRRRKKG